MARHDLLLSIEAAATGGYRIELSTCEILDDAARVPAEETRVDSLEMAYRAAVDMIARTTQRLHARGDAVAAIIGPRPPALS